MISKVKKFFLKLYMFLQNHPERTMRTLFVDFTNEDMQLEEKGFIMMMEMYERWQAKEIPMDKPTKVRIFNKLKEKSTDSVIRYKNFRERFIKVLNLNPNYCELQEKAVLEFYAKNTDNKTEDKKKVANVDTNHDIWNYPSISAFGAGKHL